MAWRENGGTLRKEVHAGSCIFFMFGLFRSSIRRQINIHLYSGHIYAFTGVLKSNLVMQVTWHMQVQPNFNAKKWQWLLATFSFVIYFKDVHEKWCQNHQRQAYTCTWWRHMNWGGKWSCQAREEFFFCSCLSGITWLPMLFSCIQFPFVCGCGTRVRVWSS